MALDPFVGLVVATAGACVINAIAIDRVRRHMRAQDTAIDTIASEQGIRVEVWPDGSAEAYNPDENGLDFGGVTYHDSKPKAVNP